MTAYRNTLKPYLINAFYTWAIDNRLTPLIEIENHPDNQIPALLNDKDTIMFNIHTSSTRNLIFSKDGISFDAQFSNQLENLSISHKHIKRIFTKEDGCGLEFQTFEDPDHVAPLTQNSELKPIKQKKHLILVKND